MSARQSQTWKVRYAVKYANGEMKHKMLSVRNACSITDALDHATYALGEVLARPAVKQVLITGMALAGDCELKAKGIGQAQPGHQDRAKDWPGTARPSR